MFLPKNIVFSLKRFYIKKKHLKYLKSRMTTLSTTMPYFQETFRSINK